MYRYYIYHVLYVQNEFLERVARQVLLGLESKLRVSLSRKETVGTQTDGWA